MRLGEATTDVAVTIGWPARTTTGPGRRPPLICASIAVGPGQGRAPEGAVFDATPTAIRRQPVADEPDAGRRSRPARSPSTTSPSTTSARRRVTAVEAAWCAGAPTARAFSRPICFIPLAEETGHIRPLTDFVLARAIDDQARMWGGGHALDVSVNISGRLLSDPRLRRGGAGGDRPGRGSASGSR